MTKTAIFITTVFIFCFIFLSGLTVNSQTLSEKLGGVKTNFTIVSDTIEMDVISQIIIQRGVASHKYDYSCDENSSYGYGYGYANQNYFLEFYAKQALRTRKIDRRSTISGHKKRYFQIVITDANGNLLYQNGYFGSRVTYNFNNDNIYVYSVNLNNIPLVILDQATTIRLEEVIVY